MTRLFYGIELPNAIKTELGHLQGVLQDAGIAANRWSPPDLFHLTVLFLGEVSDAARPVLDDIGRASALAVSPFTLTLGTVGVFARNRILWMGVQADEEMQQLVHLHDETSRRIAESGVALVESRPYCAHVTLARQLRADAVPVVEGAQVAFGNHLQGRSFAVDHLALFESTRIGGRLVYPVRSRYDFFREQGEQQLTLV